MILHSQGVGRWLARSRYLVLICCIIGGWTRTDWMNPWKELSFRGKREEGPPSERKEGGVTTALRNLGRKDKTCFSFKDGAGSEAGALLLLPHIPLLRKQANSHGTASASTSGHSALRTEHAEVERVRGSSSPRATEISNPQCHLIFRGESAYMLSVYATDHTDTDGKTFPRRTLRSRNKTDCRIAETILT